MSKLGVLPVAAKKYSVSYICTLENYNATYLQKGFPGYRRIRKRTQLHQSGHKMAANTNVSAQCITLTVIFPLIIPQKILF